MSTLTSETYKKFRRFDDAAPYIPTTSPFFISPPTNFVVLTLIKGVIDPAISSAPSSYGVMLLTL